MANSYSDEVGEALLFRVPNPRGAEPLPDELSLTLTVRDREVIEALLEHEAGADGRGGDREQFALDALRIGVVALRHASTRLDADLLRRETSQLLSTLGQTLERYSHTTREQLNGSLKEYFDPQGGRFSERVQSLVAKDGDLSLLLKEKLEGDNSDLARTLLTHVGRESPLMKLLDPQQSEGLLSALRQAVEGQLSKQSEHVLREFSLDNQQGALSRLVRELTTKHGDLNKDLRAKIDEVVKEFSLDEENSALSRLVGNVDRAQRTISSEFSLDNEQSAFSRLNRMLEATQGAIDKNLTLDDDGSPLARLKKELLELFGQAEKKNQLFQQDVRVALAEMTAKKEESQRSTRHGEVFEEAVYAFVFREAEKTGDIATATGATTGRIKNCKKGDCVIQLGPDCAAAGERIVVEAKQHGGYNLSAARSELEEARKNRDASLGLFVFSKRLAPEGVEPFARYGNDIVCIWDADDQTSDIWLKAALVTARALSVRSSKTADSQQVDFDAIDRAVLDIEKRAANLGEIRTTAETIKRGSEKILKRVDVDEKALEKNLALLKEQLDEARDALGCDEHG